MNEKLVPGIIKNINKRVIGLHQKRNRQASNRQFLPSTR